MNFKLRTVPWNLVLVLCLILTPGMMAQDDLEDRVEALEGQVSSLEGSVSVLNVEVDDVESDVFIQNGRIDNIQDDVSLLQNDVMSLTGEVDQVEDTVSTQDQRIQSLEETNSVLLARIDMLELALNDLNETVGDLDIDNSTNERLDALESDVMDLQESVERYSDATFLASFFDNPVTTTDPIVFDDAILNPGGHYDPDTGIYTVPVDGVYQFIVHYMVNTPDSDAAAHLVVDNDVVAFTRTRHAEATSDTADLVVTLSLTSGQDVWVQPNSLDDIFGSSPSQGMYSWFSGYLIYTT